MEPPATALDLSDADREEYAGKKASLALQRALDGAGAWMVTNVRDQRKCDHALLAAEIPATIREKVARVLQDRGGKEKVPDEVVDPKAPWHQQLEQHVARLMQQMRSQPQQFRQLLLLAASEPITDCVANSSSSRTFVDARRAYRRIRRAAMTLGEEIFYMVRGFVRRSEVNGVLPQDAQVVRLASLYKLELRRHVTISAVVECMRQADSGRCGPSTKVLGANKASFSADKKASFKHPLLRRQTKSAGVTSSGPGDLDSAGSSRAASAPADAAGRSGSCQQDAPDAGSTFDKVKSVHAFKLQALERLLAKTWQGSRSVSMRSLQAVPVKLSDDILTLIQERVTAFLYHRSRENYPLWDEPPFSREETARHLRTLVATLLTTPLLQSLTIDQLLEVARAARWQLLVPGDTLCVRNTEMEALIIIMDGSVASSTAPEPASGPPSPHSGSGVTITAPVSLGELSMVRNAERWPQTLIAQETGGAKVLKLPKLTFEALLHRFFNGGKASPPVLGAAASFLQPRRPSSSPAVIVRRLARSFRNSVSARRPSTAAPIAAMEANIARWHKIRDEKLRDYRAGLEAEQRVAALEALQREMDELSSASYEDDDVEFLQSSASMLSPRKAPWSRHEYYPTDTVGHPECSEHESQNMMEDSHDLIDSGNEEQPYRSSMKVIEEPTPIGSSTEVADQLRDFYRALNTRRSVMRSRLASSVPSDQMVQPSPERKASNAGTQATATASETSWWVGEEQTENWSVPSEDELDTVLDSTIGRKSGTGSPLRSRRRSPLFSAQLGSRSPASSPSKESSALPSPLEPPLKSTAPPSPNPQQEGSKGGTSSQDNDAISQTGKMEDVVPETSELDGETSPGSPSKNQVEDDRAATFTRARRSALNTMLTRQSTSTMARHSKLLDKETAQQVLFQKHFSDTSGCRPQSGRSQSAESAPSELHQSHSHAPLPLRADLQRRMDSVLSRLQLPPKTKLDLVLKYTHADYYDQFPVAVQLWERVQGVIACRERVMKSLWDFEILASDPRRHFRSISTHRLREEKERDALFHKLNQASNACLEAMDELWRSCGDTVCLGDRSYRDKMKKDYTELLYEVEQERLRIIYDGVRPHVAPAVDENDNENVREEDDKLSGHLSSGRALISVRMPPVVTTPRGLAPCRPLNMKDGHSPRVSVTTPTTNATSGIVHDNQEQESENAGAQSPKFAVDGANVFPTSTRFSLATSRESIFIPVSSLETKKEASTVTTETVQHIRRSRVTVQVQQQRRAELAALNKQLAQQQKESHSKDTMPPTQIIRPPERTFVAPAQDGKKSAARLKEQEERASLREMFQQFMTRSKS
ncbi:Coiled-coil domain-containing protein 87 [Phytophthora pseudosyringae]|uniref:Coiled-coil domain-containing protein 87 n=1 Tax=Phytophthora pseudosyringae TaxID=221518 RepID=A0A8T1VN56_9STRA|nr:Coiled-coil domain-containing protein 87 [Phytophthora pseudosyringae]